MANYYPSTDIGSPIFKHEPIPQFRPLNSLSYLPTNPIPSTVSSSSVAPTTVSLPSSSFSSARQYLQSPSAVGSIDGSTHHTHHGGKERNDSSTYYYPPSSNSPDISTLYRNPLPVVSAPSSSSFVAYPSLSINNTSSTRASNHNMNVLKSPTGVFSRTFTAGTTNVLHDGELDIEGANDDEVVSQTLRQPKVLPPPFIAQGAGPVELSGDDAYIREEEHHQQQQQQGTNSHIPVRPTQRFPLRTSPRSKASSSLNQNSNNSTKNKTIIVNNPSGISTSLSFVPSSAATSINQTAKPPQRKSTVTVTRRSKSPGGKNGKDTNTNNGNNNITILPPKIPTTTLLAEFKKRIQFNSEEFWEDSPVKPSIHSPEGFRGSVHPLPSSSNNTQLSVVPSPKNTNGSNSIAGIFDKYKEIPSIPSLSSSSTGTMYPSSSSSTFTSNLVSTLSPELSSAIQAQPLPSGLPLPSLTVDFNALREQAARLIPSATREVELEVASGKLFSRGEVGVQAGGNDIDNTDNNWEITNERHRMKGTGIQEPVSKTTSPQNQRTSSSSVTIPSYSPSKHFYQHSSSPSDFPSRYGNTDNMNEASELLASPRPKAMQQPNNRNGLMSPVTGTKTIKKVSVSAGTTTNTVTNPPSTVTRRVPVSSSTGTMNIDNSTTTANNTNNTNATYTNQHHQRRASISGTNGLGRFAQPTSSWERQHAPRESVTKPKPNSSSSGTAATNRSSSVPRQVSSSVSKPNRNSTVSASIPSVGRRASFSGVSSSVPLTKDTKAVAPRRSSISSISSSVYSNVRPQSTMYSANVSSKPRNTSVASLASDTNSTVNTNPTNTIKNDKTKATIEYLRNLLVNSNKDGGPGALVTLLERVANSEEQLSVMRYRSAYLENIIRTLTSQLQTREQQQQPLSSLTGKPIDTGSSSISMALVQGNGEATVESAMARLAAQLQTDVLENVLQENNGTDDSPPSSTDELLKVKTSPITLTSVPSTSSSSFSSSSIPAPPPTPPTVPSSNNDNQVHVRDLIAKRMAKTKNDLVISANMMRETTAQGLFPTKTDTSGSDDTWGSGKSVNDLVPSFISTQGHQPFSPRTTNVSNQFFSKLLDKTVIGATILPLENIRTGTVEKPSYDNNYTIKPVPLSTLPTNDTKVSTTNSHTTTNTSLLSTLFPSDNPSSKPVDVTSPGTIRSPRQASQSYLADNVNNKGTNSLLTTGTDKLSSSSSPSTSELVAQAHSLLQGGNGNSCSECEKVAATKRCHECAENFCDPCFDKLHSHGRRKEHLWTMMINTKDHNYNTTTKINLPSASFSQVPTSSQFQELLVQATAVKDALQSKSLSSPSTGRINTTSPSLPKRTSSDVITDSLNLISNGLSEYGEHDNPLPTRVRLLDPHHPHPSPTGSPSNNPSKIKEKKYNDIDTDKEDNYTKDVHIVTKPKPNVSMVTTMGSTTKPSLPNNKSHLPDYVHDPTLLLQRMYPNTSSVTLTPNTNTINDTDNTTTIDASSSSASASSEPFTVTPLTKEVTVQDIETNVTNRVEAQIQALAQRINGNNTATTTTTTTTTNLVSVATQNTNSHSPVTPSSSSVLLPSSSSSFLQPGKEDPVRQARMRARAQQAQSKFISRINAGNQANGSTTTTSVVRLPWPNANNQHEREN